MCNRVYRVSQKARCVTSVCSRPRRHDCLLITQSHDQLKAAHDDKIADLRRQIAKINAMIADRNNEMESLQGQIEQLEGSVRRLPLPLPSPLLHTLAHARTRSHTPHARTRRVPPRSPSRVRTCMCRCSSAR